MTTFVVTHYLESGTCNKSGKNDIEVFRVSCAELGFENKNFSKNAFRDDVKFFCALSRSFKSGPPLTQTPSAGIAFYVTAYEQDAVCDKTRKSGECYIVSCPQLGYENRPLSRNAFRDEVRFHCSGEIAEEEVNVVEMDLDEVDLREVG